MLDIKEITKYANSKFFLSKLGLDSHANLTLSPLGQGEYNANYLFETPDEYHAHRKLVLRVNIGSQMHLANQIEYEFSALKILEPCGRTPRVLFYDDTREFLPYGVLVMEWLPGRSLRYETDLKIAAAILADIHSLPVPSNTKLIRPHSPARAIYDECLEMVAHYFSWDGADRNTCRLLDALINEIGSLPLDAPSDAPLCIVNTELNSGNFLINTNATSYLVDWEKPLLSEPAQDLGHFLVPTTTFWKTDVILTPDEIAAFVKNYVRAIDGRMDTATLASRLPLFFTVTCLRGVTWCSMAMREYSSADRTLANQDTFNKIKQYLAPDFLENILSNYVRKNFLDGVI